jgi:hypothetical protein
MEDISLILTRVPGLQYLDRKNVVHGNVHGVSYVGKLRIDDS